MEPRIQYAKTEDGVSIAFWTLGVGMPFVTMPTLPVSHIQAEWQIPERRRWFERLAEKRTLIRYDARGSGLSERGVGDFSLDGQMRDLEAVVDRLDLERFALFAMFNAGPVAIGYAAHRPGRVSHLVLWCSYARASDLPPPGRAVRALMDEDWELYKETVVNAGIGSPEGEQARRAASSFPESIAPAAAQAAFDAISEFDVTALLPQVRSPTLVLDRRQTSYTGLDAAKGLAPRIPDARLALLEGTSSRPWLGDMEEVLQAVIKFLGEDEEAALGPTRSGLVTIVFTDMESSTGLSQRLGDAKAQEVRRAHNTIVRDALKTHSGQEIKHTGDGIMASFSTASSALDCAIAIQRGVAAHKEEHPDSPLAVYIGLNAGEPIAEDGDLFGTSINLAARICDHAEPGQILAADVVRQLAAGKDFLFSDLGETELRGFQDAVKLWEVRWQAGG